MIRNVLTFVLFLALTQFNCQDVPKMVMCHDPNDAIAAFAGLADDHAFRMAHPAPAPARFEHSGEMVEFAVEGGNGRAYSVKPMAPTDKYLLLLHEWWGLNDYVKNEAEFWCHELNINVLAIDLYDGKVAASPDEAGKLMQSNDPARASAIIEGAMKFAGAKADFRTMGWCFGGGWSLRTALLAKDKLRACVMFYGMPEKDVEKLKSLGSDVIFVHATKDKWINDEVVAEFEKNMKAAAKSLTVHRFEADHAFANPSSPRYNEAAAVEARKVVKAYLAGK